MDKIRRGRPKSKTPTRNKRINFPVSEIELNHIREIADKYDLTYIEIFMKGLEHWEDSEK